MYSGNLIVQVNICNNGNRKLTKKRVEQNKNAQKFWTPLSFKRFIFLTLPTSKIWNLELPLKIFSKIKKSNIKNKRATDKRLAVGKSSNIKH